MCIPVDERMLFERRLLAQLERAVDSTLGEVEQILMFNEIETSKQDAELRARERKQTSRLAEARRAQRSRVDSDERSETSSPSPEPPLFDLELPAVQPRVELEDGGWWE